MFITVKLHIWVLHPHSIRILDPAIPVNKKKGRNCGKLKSGKTQELTTGGRFLEHRAVNETDLSSMMWVHQDSPYTYYVNR
jgi:hypothetical protein